MTTNIIYNLNNNFYINNYKIVDKDYFISPEAIQYYQKIGIKQFIYRKAINVNENDFADITNWRMVGNCKGKNSLNSLRFKKRKKLNTSTIKYLKKEISHNCDYVYEGGSCDIDINCIEKEPIRIDKSYDNLKEDLVVSFGVGGKYISNPDDYKNGLSGKFDTALKQPLLIVEFDSDEPVNENNILDILDFEQLTYWQEKLNFRVFFSGNRGIHVRMDFYNPYELGWTECLSRFIRHIFNKYIIKNKRLKDDKDTLQNGIAVFGSINPKTLNWQLAYIRLIETYVDKHLGISTNPQEFHKQLLEKNELYYAPSYIEHILPIIREEKAFKNVITNQKPAISKSPIIKLKNKIKSQNTTIKIGPVDKTVLKNRIIPKGKFNHIIYQTNFFEQLIKLNPNKSFTDICEIGKCIILNDIDSAQKDREQRYNIFCQSTGLKIFNKIKNKNNDNTKQTNKALTMWKRNERYYQKKLYNFLKTLRNAYKYNAIKSKLKNKNILNAAKTLLNNISTICLVGMDGGISKKQFESWLNELAIPSTFYEIIRNYVLSINLKDNEEGLGCFIRTSAKKIVNGIRHAACYCISKSIGSSYRIEKRDMNEKHDLNLDGLNNSFLRHTLNSVIDNVINEDLNAVQQVQNIGKLLFGLDFEPPEDINMNEILPCIGFQGI